MQKVGEQDGHLGWFGCRRVHIMLTIRTQLLSCTSGSVGSADGLRAKKILSSSSKPMCMSYSTEKCIAHTRTLGVYRAQVHTRTHGTRYRWCVSCVRVSVGRTFLGLSLQHLHCSDAYGSVGNLGLLLCFWWNPGKFRGAGKLWGKCRWFYFLALR